MTTGRCGRQAPEEVTLPPLGWRMRADAGYALARVDPAAGGDAGGDADGPRVALSMCAVPWEHGVAAAYAVRGTLEPSLE